MNRDVMGGGHLTLSEEMLLLRLIMHGGTGWYEWARCFDAGGCTS